MKRSVLSGKMGNGNTAEKEIKGGRKGRKYRFYDVKESYFGIGIKV